MIWGASLTIGYFSPLVSWLTPIALTFSLLGPPIFKASDTQIATKSRFVNSGGQLISDYDCYRDEIESIELWGDFLDGSANERVVLTAAGRLAMLDQTGQTIAEIELLDTSDDSPWSWGMCLELEGAQRDSAGRILVRVAAAGEWDGTGTETEWQNSWLARFDPVESSYDLLQFDFQYARYEDHEVNLPCLEEVGWILQEPTSADELDEECPLEVGELEVVGAEEDMRLASNPVPTERVLVVDKVHRHRRISRFPGLDGVLVLEEERVELALDHVWFGCECADRTTLRQTSYRWWLERAGSEPLAIVEPDIERSASILAWQLRSRQQETQITD